MCLTDPSNDQLVKDERAQIFYSIRSQTKPIGIGANCENPSQSLPHNAAPMTWTYDRALIPLVGLCTLLIHPTTNWWRKREQKSFIAFDRRPSPLVLERIVKIPHRVNYGSSHSHVFFFFFQKFIISKIIFITFVRGFFFLFLVCVFLYLFSFS